MKSTVLLFILLLAGCATPKDNSFDPHSLVGIGVIDDSEQAVAAVKQVLDENKIFHFVHGSVVMGVHVRPEDAEKALRILKEDPRSRPYIQKFTR